MLGEKKANIKIGGNFDPIPMDKYTCQINDVSWKSQRNNFKGIEEEKLNFQFIILDDKPVLEGSSESTRGRYLWHSMAPRKEDGTIVMSKKSWIYRLAKAVYGHDLTKEEMESFDPESLIGKQVDVVVEQNTGQDGITIYSNITSYGKNIKKLPGLEVAPKEVEVIEKSTVPAKKASVPNLNPTLDDPFLDDLEDDEEDKEEEVEEESEESDEELEKLEAELKAKKLAKAKAKK